MTAYADLTLEAPAKINLTLQILGKRNDGYHDIHSLVQTVSLCDTLSFLRTASGFELITDSPETPADSSNLVWQTWELLQRLVNFEGGVRIKLSKRIPIGAGLGGGSSDAAATLKGLNRLLGLGLSRGDLAELGSRLGSDVPFFLSSGSALITGRGERVAEINLPMDYSVLLVAPGFAISTKEAYAKIRFYLTKFSIKSDIVEEIPGVGLYKAVERIGNDFQPMVLEWYPQLEDCLELMLREGARYAALSGSGSAIYGLFEAAPDPELTTSISSRWGWQVYSLSPVRLIRE